MNGMTRVKDLMEKEVATLQAADHLDLASDVMQLGRIRHMPVVDGPKLVGILSQRDLFRAGISSVLQFRPTTEREWLGKIAVRDVMSKPVTTVRAEAPIRDAVDIMIKKKIGCLPVVDDQGHLVGLLSESDALLYLETLIDLAGGEGN
jgi:CBS domain-containing membrane protein